MRSERRATWDIAAGLADDQRLRESDDRIARIAQHRRRLLRVTPRAAR
jgi:hypothetical protein